MVANGYLKMAQKTGGTVVVILVNENWMSTPRRSLKESSEQIRNRRRGSENINGLREMEHFYYSLDVAEGF